jgi:hypothetical protein
MGPARSTLPGSAAFRPGIFCRSSGLCRDPSAPDEEVIGA